MDDAKDVEELGLTISDVAAMRARANAGIQREVIRRFVMIFFLLLDSWD